MKRLLIALFASISLPALALEPSLVRKGMSVYYVDPGTSACRSGEIARIFKTTLLVHTKRTDSTPTDLKELVPAASLTVESIPCTGTLCPGKVVFGKNRWGQNCIGKIVRTFGTAALEVSCESVDGQPQTNEFITFLDPATVEAEIENE